MDASARSPNHQVHLRVRYAETDQMGVVYHANYLVWLEIGRVELVRSLGCNYKELEQSEGIYLSVVGVKCRYLSPAKYDEEIVVETGIANANPRVIEFEYRIRSADSGKLLVEASTRHLWLDRNWRPTRLPERYRNLLSPR